MEPVTIWRFGDDFDVIMRKGRPFNDPKWAEYAALPRAEFDALVKARDDWRDTAFAAYAAAHGLEWGSLTTEQIDAMEADAKANGDAKAMDAVRRLYAKWNAAVYDADKVRVERDAAEECAAKATALAERVVGSYEASAAELTTALTEANTRAARAEAERDEVVALLKEARGCVAVNYGPNEFSRLLARIDAALARVGGKA